MFHSFVSLGESCPISASMSKYGLRSYSGPFDWLITDDFQWVLHYIKNDFEDFLQRENLEIYNNNPKQFREKNSGFIFVHDDECPLEEKYDALKEKYQRRIKNFMSQTTKPTCFFRSIMNDNELKYVNENSEYINEVIKKGNGLNEIVFLIKREIEIPEIPEIPFRYYIMNEKYSTQTRELLRGWFDHENELLEFCARNFDVLTMMKNLIFDERNEQVASVRTRYNTMVKLVEFDFNETILPENIIIYGAASIGKLFYSRVKEKCNTICFIDKNKTGENIDGIPVVDLDKLFFNENVSIIVTVTYGFEAICKEIKKYAKDIAIISLNDIL